MSKAAHNSPGLSAVALFRYSVLSQVHALVLAGQPVGVAVSVVAARDHVDVAGRSVRVAVRTLHRWRAAWHRGGLAALEPMERPRTRTSVTLPPELVAFIRDEKTRDPRASSPELIRGARIRGVIRADLPVHRATVWRLCKRLGLPTRMRPGKRDADTRRWRYPHRMQCVLCDGKHFRAGATRLQRVALFFIDDATRYGLHVVVGTGESTELFLRGLHGLVRRHGLVDLLYLDKGPGFRSDDTTAVVQELGAWLVHGKTRYPQGHGAIERFHRTAFDAVLRGLDGAIDVDPDPTALTLRLDHFLHHDYNDRPHQTLGDDTPRQRWEAGRTLRFPDDDAWLRGRFVVRESRVVSADHVIKHSGKLWEAPRGLARQAVEVVRHVLDGHLHVMWRGQLTRLHELDVHANAYDRRGYRGDHEPLADEGVPTTAAMLAWQRDFAPVVRSDGGFSDSDRADSNHSRSE